MWTSLRPRTAALRGRRLASSTRHLRDRFQTIDPIAPYHALPIQDFLRAIREGRPPLVAGEDGRAVVEMFSAIYESHRRKATVALPLKVD